MALLSEVFIASVTSSTVSPSKVKLTCCSTRRTGSAVGIKAEGCLLGKGVGWHVGSPTLVGFVVGCRLGCAEGVCVGWLVGCPVGCPVGGKLKPPRGLAFIWPGGSLRVFEARHQVASPPALRKQLTILMIEEQSYV